MSADAEIPAELQTLIDRLQAEPKWEGYSWDNPTHERARAWATALLEAANVDSLGGCPLCQG